MRILQIEDDAATAQGVELMLKSEGMNIYTTDLGEEGIDLGKIYDYDLILLDLNLPDMSGMDVLRTLRVGKINTPILILTGTSDIDTKVKCFTAGADDYLTKPFHKEELVARIHAVVRRSKGHAQSKVVTGLIVVNLDAKTVEVNGTRVHLTGKEYQMLELLSLRRGTTLTKEMFLNHLYGGMDEPELKIIDVFICKLRKKLSNAHPEGEHHVETVWGRGYCLRDPDIPDVGMPGKRTRDRPPDTVTARPEPPPTRSPAMPTQPDPVRAASAPSLPSRRGKMLGETATEHVLYYALAHGPSSEAQLASGTPVGTAIRPIIMSHVSNGRMRATQGDDTTNYELTDKGRAYLGKPATDTLAPTNPPRNVVDMTGQAVEPPPPAEGRYITNTERVLRAIGDQRIAAAELITQMGKVGFNIQSNLGPLKQRGFVGVEGQQKSYKYFVTERGKDWLKRLDERDKKAA